MKQDLSGKRFGYLTILHLRENGAKRRSWLCECDCGNRIILGETLILGTKYRRPNQSCGCMKLKQKGFSMSEPKLYSIWSAMIGRCHNKNSNIYYKYGAKGIVVCDEWKDDFESFLLWSIGNGYKEGLSIDRIDGEKGYSPFNCRWVDNYVQASNKGIKETNTTGYTGVCPRHDGKFRAYISKNGKRKHLGAFDTVEEAASARKEAEDYFDTYGELPV